METQRKHANSRKKNGIFRRIAVKEKPGENM
jgi:hypothetical protein